MRLLSLLWGATLYSCVGAFIVPDQLVSLLTVVYSVIPPIKQGSDSRVGFGYRFGPFADFQVLLELGPQSETQPIGGQTTSGKRDADPAKNPDIQVLDAPDPAPSAAPKTAGSRSARSRSAPAPAPVAAAPPPPAGNSDWLSRWRTSVNGAPAARAAAAPVTRAAAAPVAASRLYSVDSRPRPVRAPAHATSYPAGGYPAVPQLRTGSSAEARWDAMRRLRSLHWAGQQG